MNKFFSSNFNKLQKKTVKNEKQKAQLIPIVDWFFD